MGVGAWVQYRQALLFACLVVFVGGPRFGGPRGGFAAWFPLGPGGIYRPVYRSSDRYIRNVNRGQVADIRPLPPSYRYRNQRAVDAVTAMPDRDFIGGRPVHRSAVSVNAREMEQAPVLGSAPPLTPDRESVLGGGSRRSAPPARTERAVVVKRAPDARPIEFGAHHAAIEANQGKPLDRTQEQTVWVTAPMRGPAVRTAPAPRVVVTPSSQRPGEGNSRPRPSSAPG